MARNIAAFIRMVLIDLAISVARRLLLFAQRFGEQGDDGIVIPV